MVREIEWGPADWPCWRGPHGDGIALCRNAPITFDPRTNVRWRTALPGRGHSTPILAGSTLYLTTAIEDPAEQRLIAIDRDSGKILWNNVVHNGSFMKKIHRQNSHASAACVWDGERIMSVFINEGAVQVTAHRPDGSLLWKTPAGKFDSIYGYGSSLALFGPLVIVNGENDQGSSFLAALHRGTGEIVWRIQRPEIDTYGTPIVAKIAGKPQLILGGGGTITSYDPLTAKLNWSCFGPTEETTANTAVFINDRVFVSGGFPKPYRMLCVRADGTGDVSRSHIVWESTRQMPYVPTPVYRNGLLFIADDWGIYSSVDALTGKPIATKRLGGDITASPVLCGEHLYVANEEGKVFVLKADRSGEVVSVNDLAEGIMATPVIAEERIYVRTLDALWCFAAEKRE